MEKHIKKLPATVNVKGCNIPGLTATLVQRTDKVAWYLRSDGYHEVFQIKSGRTFDGSGLMEYYPGTTDFGKTAWCIREEGDALRYYSSLCLGRPVHEKTSIVEYKDTTSKHKFKIRQPQILNY